MMQLVHKLIFGCAVILLPNGLLFSQLVDRTTFFQHVMGVDESTFQTSNYAKDCISVDINGNAVLINAATQEKFQAGKFEQLSISDVRQQAAMLPKQGTGTFHVYEAVNPAGQPYLRKVDIGAMQADPSYNDAVFQVASNFNGLELVSKHDPMTGITNYVHDKTQGPFASISAAPGTILRHYYMFYDPKTNAQTWKQTPEHQINFLDRTDIPVTNSYVDFTKKNPSSIKNYSANDIKVGYHRDIQVTFGFMPNFKQHEMVSNPHQVINQVFVAAVDFGCANAGYEHQEIPTKIAQAILDAAYEGTIKAAAVNNKKTVVLTLVGGGVFQNSLDAIYSAIEKNIPFIKDSGLHVELIIFNSASYDANQMNAFRNKLQSLYQQGIGGMYTKYTPANPAGE